MPFRQTDTCYVLEGGFDLQQKQLQGLNISQPSIRIGHALWKFRLLRKRVETFMLTTIPWHQVGDSLSRGSADV